MEQPVENRGTKAALRKRVMLQFGSPTYIWSHDRKALESQLLFEVCWQLQSQGEVSVIHLWVIGQWRDSAVSLVSVLNQPSPARRGYTSTSFFYIVLHINISVSRLLLFFLWIFLDCVSIYFHMTLLKQPKLARIPHSSMAEWDGRTCHLW